jgi:hypothetical protein
MAWAYDPLDQTSTSSFDRAYSLLTPYHDISQSFLFTFCKQLSFLDIEQWTAMCLPG